MNESGKRDTERERERVTTERGERDREGGKREKDKGRGTNEVCASVTLML